MRKLMLVVALCCLPLLMAADNGQQVTGRMLCGLDLPCTCELDCVTLSIDCGKCPDGSTDPIVIEFLAPDATVLGTATMAGPWCEPCYGNDEGWASIDKPVNPNMVKYVRISKPGDDNLWFKWMKLRASYGGNCCKQKWHTLYKGDVCIELGKGAGADEAIVLM